MSSKSIPQMSESELRRFASKITYAIFGDCWLWQAAKDGDGYGIFYLSGANFKAHRLAYYMRHKVDPDKLLVSHTCEQNHCVNPDHLILTKKTVSKKQSRKRRSDSTPLSVIESVKQHIAEGVLSQKEIAAKFMLTSKTVSKIKRGGYATNAD